MKAYFKDTDSTTKKDENAKFIPEKQKPWTPSQNHHSIETFIDLVQHDINDAKILNSKRPKDNLTKGEQISLEELSKRDDIIITNADKGAAIVIMDIDKYISQAQRQLNDENSYKKLRTDPTLHKLVNDTVEKFKKDKSIPTKIADGLINSNPRTPKFYISPKIHKENNLGRPVISSINCYMSKISKYVDYHLQPIKKEIPSYIKDINDFINKINNRNIPKESIFVTLDVKSLYASIPNPEGIAAVKKAHERYQHKTVPTKVIASFLALILTLNNFIFNSKFYLQIKGCEMGTICAPPDANIFMAYFEEKFIYPLIRNATKLYLRYIDDIILKWTKSENELLTFSFEKLNQQDPSIKFEMKYSKDKIEFLDTLIYKDKNNNIQITLYKKLTDRQN